MTGSVAYHGGRVAEDQVADFYVRLGCCLVASRWRGPGGEIDLIFRDGARLVFVEVKRADTHAEAALRVTPRQIARIEASARAFLSGEPSGQDTEVSIEVALVDGSGRIEIIPNASV